MNNIPLIFLGILFSMWINGCTIVEPPIKTPIDATIEKAIDSTLTFKTNLPVQHHKAVANIKISTPLSIYIGEIAAQNDLGFDGVKKNEYGIAKAKLYCKPDSVSFFKQALTLELTEAGFEVKEGYNKTELQIKAHLHQCFVEPKVSLVYATVCGVIEADIIIGFPNGTAYRRRFKGFGQTHTSIWYSVMPIFSNSLYTATLELAMNRFMKKAIPAVSELIQQQGSLENSSSKFDE